MQNVSDRFSPFCSARCAAPKPGFDPANDREIASISELINKLRRFAVLAESGRFRLDE
jgi:hypothetical protein